MPEFLTADELDTLAKAKHKIEPDMRAMSSYWPEWESPAGRL